MKKPLNFFLILGCCLLFLAPVISVRSQSPHSQKPGNPRRPQSLELPNQTLQKDSRNFADRLTQLVVSPFTGQQEIMDVIKAISRYYTGGGSHQIGIKVDI